jgi:vacuolar-type H+-ATPase subunit H
MQDELLAEILATEQEIRERIAAWEAENAARLDALRREFDAELAREAERLRNELGGSLETAEQAARSEADMMLSAARTRAERLGSLDDEMLDRAVVRHLRFIRPEAGHDRQDEQT